MVKPELQKFDYCNISVFAMKQVIQAGPLTNFRHKQGPEVPKAEPVERTIGYNNNEPLTKIRKRR
jgi:hypothetical protein